MQQGPDYLFDDISYVRFGQFGDLLMRVGSRFIGVQWSRELVDGTDAMGVLC
jgi:hypothetical protein